MTPEEFATEVTAILDKYRGEEEEDGQITVTDIEAAHVEMDGLMCKLLSDLGYGAGVDLFKRTEKWYA